VPNTITSPQHLRHSAIVTEPSQSNSCNTFGPSSKFWTSSLFPVSGNEVMTQFYYDGHGGSF